MLTILLVSTSCLLWLVQRCKFISINMYSSVLLLKKKDQTLTFSVWMQKEIIVGVGVGVAVASSSVEKRKHLIL